MVPEEPSGAVAAGHRSPEAVTALVHLHRAEVGRLTAYRLRLDTTTNWAITSTALVTTFALGQEGITHAAFLFLMFSNYFLLALEAHRYRLLEAVRERVTLLERHFYPEVIAGLVSPGWEERLLESLRDPRTPVSAQAARAWRLRRNYLAIYAAVLVAWLVKLDLNAGAGLDTLVSHAAVASLPGWLVLAGVAVLYSWLGWLAWNAPRLYPGAGTVI